MPSPTARVLAQAKVNLLLRVGARDASGYHEIGTVFQRLDLADEIVVRAAGTDRSLDVSGPRVPAEGLGPVAKNLAFRAAVAYAERATWLRGFAIELTKHIPAGGGLGGGSADAGAVLRALDALAPRPLGGTALWEIGRSLGSDVPFLTTEHAIALGGGRGDKLAGAESLHARDVVLLIPSFGIATADAYDWLDEGRGNTPVPPVAPATGKWGWDFIERHSINDFEPVVERRHPELRAYRQRLGSLGARVARLAGSGSTVFGVFAGSAPNERELALDALMVASRTSTRVVQVEVLE
jgi:4-diphosphocytidyl-2-C-methyl-D-erythritol kinase